MEGSSDPTEDPRAGADRITIATSGGVLSVGVGPSPGQVVAGALP